MATAGTTTAGMAAAGTTDEHTRHEQRIIPHHAKAPITLCPYRGFRASQGGRSDGKPIRRCERDQASFLSLVGVGGSF
jgi:hypothetical protein